MAPRPKVLKPWNSNSNPTINIVGSPFVYIYIMLCCGNDCACINTIEKRLRMRVIRDCQAYCHAYVVILKVANLQIFYPGYVYLLGGLRANICDRKEKGLTLSLNM